MLILPRHLQWPCAALTFALLVAAPLTACSEDAAKPQQSQPPPPAVSVLIPPLSEPPAEPPKPLSPMHQKLEELAASAKPKLGRETLYAAKHLLDLYQKSNFQPLWTSQDKVAELKKAVLAVADEGLNPKDYHLDAIRIALGEKVALPAKPASQKAQTTAGANEAQPPVVPAEDPAVQAMNRDIVLSDALILLGEHLLHGKVGSDVPERRAAIPTPPEVDLDAYLNMIRSGSIVTAMQARVPQSPHYRALKAALAQSIRPTSAALEAEDSVRAMTQIPEGPGLGPGMRGSRVRDLKTRLVEGGFLMQSDIRDDLYDQALVEAVKKFQISRRLKADGLAGRQTIAVLNGKQTTVVAPNKGERAKLIRANMERARWIMRELPKDAIVVDIPRYQLHYYKDGQEVWTTRVVVGRPNGQTPSYHSAINSVVLNPTWTVPPGMMRKEYLPRLYRNPGAVGGLAVYDRSGRRVNPASVNWNACRGGSCPYMLRQPAGARNALGKVKFMFPNPHSVYLHDTPGKWAFGAKNRALSHGCVRVENPKELAHRILSGDPENPMTPKQFDRLLASGKTGGITLKKPLPVFLLYATAKGDKQGKISYAPDIYKRDAAVIAALDRAPQALPKKPPVVEKPADKADSTASAASKTQDTAKTAKKSAAAPQPSQGKAGGKPAADAGQNKVEAQTKPAASSGKPETSLSRPLAPASDSRS